MSAKTRIKRPTTATPAKLPTRMVHQSTHYGWVDANSERNPSVRPQFVKLAKGTTYRKVQP